MIVLSKEQIIALHDELIAETGGVQAFATRACLSPR